MVNRQQDKGVSSFVALLRGNWNNGANAGAFYWNVNNSSSNRNRNIGAQLSVFEIYRVALALAKT